MYIKPKRRIKEELIARFWAYYKLMAWVVVIYYCILASLIGLVYIFNVDLSIKGNPFSFQNPFLFLLASMYYVAPVFIAVGFGFSFKPFWRHFRNMLMIILAIHGLYSLTGYILRCVYLNNLKEMFNQSQLAQLKVTNFSHEFIDENEDGVVDKIKFKGQLDGAEFSNGTYQLDLNVSQYAKNDLPLGPSSNFVFSLTDKSNNTVSPVFEINAHDISAYSNNEDFYIDLQLKQKFKVSQGGVVIKNLNRWNAFFRATGWDGSDQDIVDQDFLIDAARKVDTFSLLPLEASDNPVIFQGFLGDEAIDHDGDGFFDELMISVKIYSQVAQEASISTQTKNIQSEAIHHRIDLEKGANIIPFSVKGEDIKKWGKDGPYKFVNFVIFNSEVNCSQEDCTKSIKPLFTEKLGSYTTQAYQLKQFK